MSDVVLTADEIGQVLDCFRDAGAVEVDPVDICLVVEEIVADRLAAERERIAQAIEAMRTFVRDINPASRAHVIGFGTARKVAARIARAEKP